MMWSLSIDFRNFGGLNSKVIDTRNDPIVAIIIPPKVPANRADKTMSITTSNIASSYLLCSNFHFTISMLKAAAIAIMTASIIYLDSMELITDESRPSVI